MISDQFSRPPANEPQLGAVHSRHIRSARSPAIHPSGSLEEIRLDCVFAKLPLPAWEIGSRLKIKPIESMVPFPSP
jgi:hypothetical protein